jgi:molecular chaperone DnaJ
MSSVDLQKALEMYGYNSISEVSNIELKQRYKSLAKKHHPDRGGEEEMFVAIREMYQLIRDELDNPKTPNEPAANNELEQKIQQQKLRIQEYEAMITAQVHVITGIQPILNSAHETYKSRLDSLDEWYLESLDKLKKRYESSFMDLLLNKSKLTQTEYILEKNNLTKSYNSQLLGQEQEYTKNMLKIYKSSIEDIIDSYT